MDEETFPTASELCRWINPSSGRPTEFPLQHALDYVYFVDGGRTPVPDSVGQSFCQPPAQRVRFNEVQFSNDALELFDPFVDVDEHEMTEPESILMSNSKPARSLPVKRQKHQRVSSHSALDKDASIVKLLRDDPDLLNHFLKIRQSNASRSPTSANTDDKCSDGQDNQQYGAPIHDQNMHSPHDKISSISTIKLQQKSIKGMSIRHFARISHDDRVGWLESAECLEDVIDAARSTHRVTWNRAELPYVVYWVNGVLEDFREAIAARSDISQVRQRCSTGDRLLRDFMFVKLHRQVDELKHLQATTALHRTKEVTVSRERTILARETRTIREATKSRVGRIPKHVLRRLPAQVDPATGETLELCMRYLSNEGCIEDSNGCPSDRGHFVPKKLPEKVEQEITKRFGGLKQEHRL
ncbi:LOW QUALITY PROTEIN: Hypothetical protein PHPALM_10117 [Phytophthora palmivora]|uniref:Uncharacterized protein n=1 Tax=Phytophthora palmivora TaxID=4796 RepID=A0A2P4Y5K4_9STRA|nr:LOW QUALITY PROTEIN: Hypothetical protein PHPALM_10117 [Phytophthora palmivora]